MKNRRRVFLNIPYDDNYSREIFPAILTVCWGYGLNPFLQKEDVAVDNRLAEIKKNILKSSFMIADLSRPTRMNMPFEAGIAVAYDTPCVFLVDQEFKRKRNISDLAGVDFIEHSNCAQKLMKGLSLWISQQLKGLGKSGRPLPAKTMNLIFRANKSFISQHAKLKDYIDLEEVKEALLRIYSDLDIDDMIDLARPSGSMLPFVAAKHLKLMKQYAEVMAS